MNNISDPNKIQVGTVLVIKNNNKSTPVSTMSKIPSISQANEPWYNSVLDAVSGVEESVKKGGERVIDKVSNGIDSIAEAGEKTYDYVFGDDDKQPSPSNTSSKPSQPSLKSNTQNSKPITNNNTLDLQNEVGNNQNGHPAEQISYGSDTTVYHIYHDGNIKRENGQAVGYAAFIYYDEGGNKHYLGKTEYIKTRRWKSKGVQGNGYVYLVCIGGDERSRGVDDNTISAAEKEKRLSKYRKGNVGYEIHMNSSSQRYFMSGIVMASFLGSLCKLGYDDITFNGASKEDGSPGVSDSHINGKCVDVRYLRTDKAAKKVLLQDPEYDHQRTVRMVETFYEFGWGQAKRSNGSTIRMLSEEFINRAAGVTSKALLPHCSHYNKTSHNNHLHLQGLSPRVEDINVIHRIRNTSVMNNNIRAPIEELRVRAFMRMLRVGEGTEGDIGYETLFGGRSFIKHYGRDFSDHPRIHRPFGKTTSTAAGAYQVMGYTWDDKNMVAKRKQYGVTSFSKRDQDIFAVILLKYKRPRAWPFLIQGRIQQSLELGNSGGYAYEWASLPPGRYGQPNKTMSEALSYYNKFFTEESNGQTDLAIEYGFLKEIFGV